MFTVLQKRLRGNCKITTVVRWFKRCVALKPKRFNVSEISNLSPTSKYLIALTSNTQKLGLNTHINYSMHFL